MPETTPHVMVIGGGLAGMVVAKELAARQIAVTIVEKGARLGGKAGADARGFVLADGRRTTIAVEHGYHVFAGWYRNTRRLLHELGIEASLLDSDHQCFLHRPERPGQPPPVYEYYAITSIGTLLHNVFRTALPWHVSVASWYALLDLAAEPFSNRGFLDRVSVSGFFRSRFYRHESIADFHHQSVLQSQAVSYYELSAMTLQKAVQCFMWTPRPMVSFLPGDLQTTFITPFQQLLERYGVAVVQHRDVNELLIEQRRVAGVRVNSPEQLGITADVYVLATPPDVTARFVGEAVYEIDREAADGIVPLSGIQQLKSVPMAAMYIHFPRRVANVPAAHTSLHQSRYGISFIDVSQHWPELREANETVLSVVAADVRPLMAVPGRRQVRAIATELLEYLGIAEPLGEITEWEDSVAGQPVAEKLFVYSSGIRVQWQPNRESPLFLNTTGAWHYRPETRTAIANLFVTGDYCRTEADLATMESAVASGIATARDVLAALGKEATAVEPLPLDLPPRWLLVLLKYALFPAVLPIGAYYAIQRALEVRDDSLLGVLRRWIDGDEPSLADALRRWTYAQVDALWPGGLTR